ncbi:MAG: phosphoribosylformylglycinamidine cyclo-ligase [Spirochaetia bacterium]|jgi:phosphoribosylformylglycinamidine cyclo-ligase|nr:phosphoribosylformylglycinamidine cyclo-ligase [Spirochaetia bacterium]
MSENLSYKNSGVDLKAGYRSVELIKEKVRKTMTGNALSMIGGFGGSFQLDTKGMEQPVLVSGTDGVGTKLKIAFLLDKHDTVGIDCVAMCVNDIICCGARPLFFLDYIAIGKNIPEKVADIVEGVSQGCLAAKAAIVGGETAEMPGFYQNGEYDIAGFAVGIVDKKKMIGPELVEDGDAIVALPSSGVHSNGFSLVRKVFDLEKDKDKTFGVLDKPLAQTLLTPTCIYVSQVLPLIEKGLVKSVAHITGGGFFENIPRSLKPEQDAVIDMQKIRIPAIFQLIQDKGNITEENMFNTFNMGVGMCLTVASKDTEAVLAQLDGAYQIGTVVHGNGKVIL